MAKTRKKLRLLIGGSPCTHWSIAQKNNRETEPSGIGWELFKNYLIAKEKFKPHYFLYENNVSASKAIKEQIKKELGVWDGSLLMPDTGARYIEINSALVSAQNRKRFYVHNIPEVGQPADRGILLKDILESGVVDKEKAYCLKHQAGNARDYFKKHHTQIAFEPVSIGTIESIAKNQAHDSKQYRVYSPKGKSTTICGQGGGMGAKTGLYATPIEPACVAQRGRYTGHNGEIEQNYEARQDGKTNVITTVTKDNLVAVPVCMRYERSETAKKLRKQYEAGEIKHGFRELSELHPRPDGKTNTLSTVLKDNPICEPVQVGCYPSPDGTLKAVSCADGKTYPVYTVANGLITIKDKQYPIKLPDGYYIIRKLTVLECKRLQTVRDDYIFPVSNTQAYKMLGNGWTVDVIAHILSHIPHLQDYELEVLSVYDGMSCGNLALEKLGCKIARYVSYEIDKWAIETTQANFPFVEQRGDAFQIREHDWKY